MDSSWLVVWWMVFSVIGTATFTYGYRQRKIAPTVFGVALIMYPYFLNNVWAVIGVGVLLIAGLIVTSQWESGV